MTKESGIYEKSLSEEVETDLREAAEIQWDYQNTVEVAKMIQRERHFRQFMEFVENLVEQEG